ncbi:MAG TPA: recombination regulator RecX [Fluviicoccus sp.]|nr:recombination regulator RecX [Fluviicoccus sp.]
MPVNSNRPMPKPVAQGMSEPPSPLSPVALRSRALAFLSRREHTRQELREKLTDLGGSVEEIAAILDELAERNWQSDNRFAEAYVRQESRKGHGPLNIRQSLKQRGVDEELIANVLMTEDWLEWARLTRQRKFGEEPPTDRKEQARQLRFLQYRGFTSDQCRKALRNVED